MRIRFFAFGFACGIACVLATGEARSGDTPKVDQEMLKRWQKYALPGEPHRRLEVYDGKWDVEMKMFMEGADRPPVVNTATQRYEMLFGGRFVQTELAGTMMMDIDGELMAIPIEAIGYTGYDNFKEKYVAVWIDSHATGIWTSEGYFDEDRNAFVYIATWDDWETGDRDRPYKLIERIVDDNTIEGVMYDLAGVKPVKIWESTMRRRSAR